MNKEEAIKKGYTCFCANCNTAYKKTPKEWYEDGHGGRYINMCKTCPCDLIVDMKTDELLKC